MVTTEASASSELSVRLTKAQELIDHGKQRRALGELWEAEALARGNADSLRQMSDFARTFQQRVEPKQASRLAELVAALEHDADNAARAPEASSAVPTSQAERSVAVFYLGLFVSLLLAAGVSGLTLVIWWFNTTNPCPCSGDFCIFGNPAAGGADAHLVGALPGLLYGGVSLLIVSGYLIWQFRARLRYPFLSLVVGFPVLYGCLLASSWAVARLIWGPTRCLA